MDNWLVSPPVVFLIVLAASWVLAVLFSRLSFRGQRLKGDEGKEAYACGEDNYDSSAQPDYSLFFPFAFFFTLAHVATLIVTTVPAVTARIFVVAAIYIVGAVIGLFILLRK